MERGGFNPEITNPAANEIRIDKNESIIKVNQLYEDRTLAKSKVSSDFISAIENLPDYVAYKKQPVTYETFDNVIHSIKEQINDLPSAEQDKIIQNIEILAGNIKKAVHAYYEAVRRHHHTERQVQLGRSSPDAFQAADKTRTNAHNNVISNLAAFSRMCFVTLTKEYDLKLDRDHWFQGYEFDNRHILGQWALRTEFGHRVDVLKEKALEDIKKETA